MDPESLVRGFDAVFRRATSVQRFVIRGETIASRREAVLWIAWIAVRHEETSRADVNVLLLLRRALPQIERRKWIPIIQADTRGFKTAVFADYSIVPQATAEAEMQRLLSVESSSDALLASTDLPPRAFS